METSTTRRRFVAALAGASLSVVSGCGQSQPDTTTTLSPTDTDTDTPSSTSTRTASRLKRDDRIEHVFEFTDATSPFLTADGQALYVLTEGGELFAVDGSDGSRRWHREVGGAGVTRPVVRDETLYLTTSRSEVVAVDTATGDMDWTVRIDADGLTSPTVTEERVYVGSEDRTVHAIDADGGTERWHQSVGTLDRSSVLAPPAADGDTLYVGNGNGLVTALRADTGETVWRARAGRVRSQPVVAGDRLLVGHTAGYHLLNTRDGSVVATHSTEAIASQSDVTDGVVYATDFAGDLHAIRTDTGERVWQFETDGERPPEPAVANGTVYFNVRNRFAEPFFYALGTDGTVRWRWRMPEGVRLYSAPTLVGDTVFVTAETGRLVGLRTDQ
ncbi:MAG: PQQ-binding-like beta-propeller repeat protein [Halobaculum sp.]